MIDTIQPGEIDLRAKLNEIIKVVNALQNVTISPDGIGSFTVSGDNAKLAFNVDKCET